MIRKYVTLFWLVLSLPAMAVSLDSLYSPRIEGVIRAKYEYNSNLNAHRFQVRNARFSVIGKFSPAVSYKAEIDLSDEGETKMLDAFLRYQPRKWFTFTIGQQKLPFSTDNLRSPNQLYFANRSFIGKQLTGLRDVGATLGFFHKKYLPVDWFVGVYNGTGLYNQQTWRKADELSYLSRLVIYPVKDLMLTANFNSVKPYSLRMNMFNFGGAYTLSGWHIETEYFHKTYSGSVFDATTGFFGFVAYDVPTPKWKSVKKVTPLIRYDMMTDNNKGKALTDGSYVTDDVARSRITAGLTISLDKPFMNDIRINYEQYSFDAGITNDQNKLVVEYVVRF